MHSFPARDLSGVIGRIYDCALQPRLWATALDEMRRLLACKSGHLFLNDLRTHRTLIQTQLGVEPDYVELQQSYLPAIHAHIGLWLDDGVSLDEPWLVSRHAAPELVTASAYVREWDEPQGFIDCAITTLMHSPTRWSAICFRRHASVGAFGESDVELLRRLIPHVRRAVTVSNALDAREVEKARLAETLDALKLGVILADADARVLHSNAAADDLMRRGVLLRDAAGCLRANGTTAEIRAAITLAARDPGGAGKSGIAVRLDDDEETPVVAHVLPLGGGEVRTRLDPVAIAAVFINTPLDEARCAATVTRAFNLTPAETRVLGPILSGRTVVEAADDAGVAMTTARTHLNSIFAKTGVSRQSELLKLAASVAPAV